MALQPLSKPRDSHDLLLHKLEVIEALDNELLFVDGLDFAGKAVAARLTIADLELEARVDDLDQVRVGAADGVGGTLEIITRNYFESLVLLNL